MVLEIGLTQAPSWGMLSQNSGPETGCGVENAVCELLGDMIEVERYSPHGKEFEMVVPEKNKKQNEGQGSKQEKT
jgi:hypothetical protein